jgi:CRP/FNR family cyclic AMP-dependent transcriptional regulator
VIRREGWDVVSMAADPVIWTALGETDLFSSLRGRALDAIASQAKLVHHPAGKQITTEGRSGIGFHLITAGTATVSVGNTELGQIGPGKYFGDISLIDGGPRSATITTDTEVTTIFIPTWNFTPILESEPEVARALLLVMCARLRAAEQR